MSSPAAQPAPVAKTPFLVAAVSLLAVAVLVGVLAIRPLGATELLGMFGCVAAAAVFAAIPHVVDFTRRLDASRPRAVESPVPAPAPAPVPAPPPPAPRIDAALLAAEVSAAVEARIEAATPTLNARIAETVAAAVASAFAAAEEKRRAEVEAALVATTPPRALDADAVPVSAPGAKPRLGRGLLGLMHGAGALSRPDGAPGPTDRPAQTEPSPGEAPSTAPASSS